MTDAPISPDQELEERRKVLKVLRAVFPASVGAFLPLAIGVRETIAMELPDLPAGRLAAVLAYHARSMRYVKAVAKPGAMRVDLRGQPVEPVSEDHRAHAAAQVAGIQKLLDARKKAA